METGIKIRKLEKRDFNSYCYAERTYAKELKTDPYFGVGEYGKKLTRKILEKRFSEIIKKIADGKSTVLVATEKEAIVGICELDGNAWMEGPHVANIGYSVLKVHRGKGIGTALVKEMLKLARKKYEIVIAGFFANNTASRKLLKKFGFKKFAFGPKFSKRNRIYLDSEMMYLRLR